MCRFKLCSGQIFWKVSWTGLGIPLPSIHLCLWQSQQNTFGGASLIHSPIRFVWNNLRLVLQQHQGLTNLCQTMKECLSWAERVCLYGGSGVWGNTRKPTCSLAQCVYLSTYSSWQNTREHEETVDFILDKQLKCKPVGEWMCVPFEIADQRVLKPLINLCASLK